jgi:sec-independent protein translocase protein TatC
MARRAPEAPADEHAPGEMTLLEHLSELRSVLVQSLGVATGATVLAWFVSERAVDLLIRPAVGSTGDLVFLSPPGAFMLRIKTAFGIGLLLAAPFIVWRVWSFVVPGLRQGEKRVLLPVVFSSIILFYTGAAFAYFVILPITMKFLLAFGTEHLTPMISGERYFEFALRLALAFGAVFQFPLVVSLLTYWEILGPDFLQKYWRYGVVLVFVLSALLTPPDIASQMLMAGPVLLLYFVSLGLAKLIARRRGR